MQIIPNRTKHQIWLCADILLNIAAKYADPRNLGTPIGWPTIKSQRKIPTAQEVTDRIFTSLRKDMGNRRNVSIFHMVFGQFLDHDFALSTNSGQCKNPRYISICLLSNFSPRYLS